MARSENNSRNALYKSRIQFTSAESASRAGVDVDVVQEHAMIDAITANGELVLIRLASLIYRRRHLARWYMSSRQSVTP